VWFPDLTAKRAQLDGTRPALVDAERGRTWTYAELDERACRAARYLQDGWGVRPGDRVASLAQNRTDTLEMLFACAKLGAVLVPLNWRLAVPELAYVLADAEVVGLVNDEVHAQAATRLREQVRGPNDAVLRAMAYGDDPLDTETSYEAALAGVDGSAWVHAPREETELWYLLYTSGTTGRPKGVLQTYGMALVNYLNIGVAAGLTSQDRFLSVLPQFHTAGFNLYTLPMLIVGGTTVCTAGFDPQQTTRLLTGDVSVFFGVPTVYQMLADTPEFMAADVSGVRSWACGGAAMPVPLLERLATRGVHVRQGMGMTETGPTVFLLDEGHAISKAGSVGKPQPFVDVRLVTAEGKEPAVGEPGELLIRGPGVTPGYWRLPEVTAASFDEDGWLRSGDVARQDEDGDFYLVDRVKDMFISGGENVYPAEVEAVLSAMSSVAECAVVGVPDPRWGEVGKAFLVTAPDATVDAEAVREHCRARLAAYKVPRHVECLPELPRNATGKLLKHVLREREVAR